MDILCGNYGDYNASYVQTQFGNSAQVRDMFGQATGTATHLRVYNLDANQDVYFGVWNEAGDTLLATAEGVDMAVGVVELPLSASVAITSDTKYQFKFRANGYWDVGQIAPDAVNQSWKAQARDYSEGQWTQAAIGSTSGSTGEKKTVMCVVGTRTGPTLANVSVDTATESAVTVTLDTDDATGVIDAIIDTTDNCSGLDAWNVTAGNNVLGAAATASILDQAVSSTAITLNFSGLSLTNGNTYRLRLVQTSASAGYSDIPTVDFVVSSAVPNPIIQTELIVIEDGETPIADTTSAEYQLKDTFDGTVLMSGSDGVISGGVMTIDDDLVGAIGQDRILFVRTNGYSFVAEVTVTDGNA